MPILTNSDNLVRATDRTWQEDLKDAIRTPEELAAMLEIPLKAVCAIQSRGKFPLFAPLPFLNRVQKGDLRDPLLRQILPVAGEADSPPGFADDPLDELDFQTGGGLLHKYSGRALLVVNGTCAVHCRYCFRRHFPYTRLTDVAKRWEPAIARIGSDPSIGEVILSGGDPLTLNNEVLSGLIARIADMGHVRRLRIHSRLPVVIPNRVDDDLLELLRSTRLDVVGVIHCNHAQEIDDQVVFSCERLSAVCTSILNQSVLLRDVNDNVDALIELSEKLFSASVLPYYLHQLDRVKGAAHFEVPRDRGRELVLEMRARLPGYLVPRYVQEEPGEPNKSVIA